MKNKRKIKFKRKNSEEKWHFSNCILLRFGERALRRGMQAVWPGNRVNRAFVAHSDIKSEQKLHLPFFCGGPGEYSQKIWVGMCGPLPKTLILFVTKSAIFVTLFMTRPKTRYPIYDRCGWYSFPKRKFWRVLVGNLKRTPKRYHDPGLWEWLEIFFSPKRNQF